MLIDFLALYKPKNFFIMPVIEQSEYNFPPIIHRNRHISTIYAALFKKFEVTSA